MDVSEFNFVEDTYSLDKVVEIYHNEKKAVAKKLIRIKKTQSITSLKSLAG